MRAGREKGKAFCVDCKTVDIMLSHRAENDHGVGYSFLWWQTRGEYLLGTRAVFKWLSKNQKPITTGADSAMNQSQFLAITCNSLEAREKWRVHSAIGFGFGFDSHRLKNWRKSFKPIPKRSNRNYVITFDAIYQKRVRVFHQGFQTPRNSAPRAKHNLLRKAWGKGQWTLLIVF